MAQTFTRMDQSTPEQWAVIGRETSEHQSRVAERALELLRSLAEITDGFAVDQLTHSLQTATRAERGGADAEMVFASLLHDIGKAISVPNHPEIAAAIIKPYVRPEVHEVIHAHQDFQGRHYYAHFGGDPDARAKYEGEPWFDLAARFADEWDQVAFDPDYDTLPLEHFEPLVRETFARSDVLTPRAVLLDGKVAIVSGVGPGLGQANARALAREGATVVLAARNAEYLAQVRSEIEGDGGRALAVPTNLVDTEQVDALVNRTIDVFGGLDILVNNAFRMDRGQPFESAALDSWRKVYEVNVWGALGLTQACIPHLRTAAAERGDASIVFILSMSMRKIRPNEGAYSTSKGALRTAVQALALELGPARVRVNGVAPGWIGGPNVEVFITWESENRSIEPTVVREEIEARIPLGLIPPQDEIAHSVVFFASPWSKVVTGQTLDVNGGEWFD